MSNLGAAERYRNQFRDCLDAANEDSKEDLVAWYSLIYPDRPIPINAVDTVDNRVELCLDLHLQTRQLLRRSTQEGPLARPVESPRKRRRISPATTAAAGEASATAALAAQVPVRRQRAIPPSWLNIPAIAAAMAVEKEPEPVQYGEQPFFFGPVSALAGAPASASAAARPPRRTVQEMKDIWKQQREAKGPVKWICASESTAITNPDFDPAEFGACRPTRRRQRGTFDTREQCELLCTSLNAGELEQYFAENYESEFKNTVPSNYSTQRRVAMKALQRLDVIREEQRLTLDSIRQLPGQRKSIPGQELERVIRLLEAEYRGLQRAMRSPDFQEINKSTTMTPAALDVQRARERQQLAEEHQAGGQYVQMAERFRRSLQRQLANPRISEAQRAEIQQSLADVTMEVEAGEEFRAEYLALTEEEEYLASSKSDNNRLEQVRRRIVTLRKEHPDLA